MEYNHRDVHLTSQQRDGFSWRRIAFNPNNPVRRSVHCPMCFQRTATYWARRDVGLALFRCICGAVSVSPEPDPEFFVRELAMQELIASTQTQFSPGENREKEVA